jgi:hypothetical protein
MDSANLNATEVSTTPSFPQNSGTSGVGGSPQQSHPIFRTRDRNPPNHRRRQPLTDTGPLFVNSSHTVSGPSNLPSRALQLESLPEIHSVPRRPPPHRHPTFPPHQFRCSSSRTTADIIPSNVHIPIARATTRTRLYSTSDSHDDRTCNSDAALSRAPDSTGSAETTPLMKGPPTPSLRLLEVTSTPSRLHRPPRERWPNVETADRRGSANAIRIECSRGDTEPSPDSDPPNESGSEHGPLARAPDGRSRNV